MRSPPAGAREALSVLLAAALAGCGGTPFKYHSQREIPEGPGLLTGESGAFVIYSDKKVKADRPPAIAQEEFREFREWKESAKDTPEFREFQDWREWKAKDRQPK